MPLLLPGTEALAAVRHAPHYRLYISPLGGGDAQVQWYFPHCDYFDAGFREAVQYVAAHAADFGIEFSTVRVVLRGTPDTTSIVKDTTISFNVGSQDITLDLDLRSQTQMLFGLWERETYAFVGSVSANVRWLIDVGAGSGEMSLYFLRQPGPVEVIAAEPEVAAAEETTDATSTDQE